MGQRQFAWSDHLRVGFAFEPLPLRDAGVCVAVVPLLSLFFFSLRLCVVAVVLPLREDVVVAVVLPLREGVVVVLLPLRDGVVVVVLPLREGVVVVVLPLRDGVPVCEAPCSLPLRVGVAGVSLREGLAPVVGDVAVPLCVGVGRTPDELREGCGVSICGRSTPGVHVPRGFGAGVCGARI